MLTSGRKITKAKLWEALAGFVGGIIGISLMAYGHLIWNPASGLRIEAIQTAQIEQRLIISEIDVANRATFDLKDPTIACEFVGASGTIISTNVQVEYQVVPVGTSLHFGCLPMGAIPAQTARIHCYVKDVTVKWSLVGLLGLSERNARRRR